MPGGWTMSTMWLPMCGQSWLGAAAGFVGTWAAMMVPMMLPLAVVPLRRYRAALEGRAPLFTVAAGLAWAATWTAFGLPVYLAGAVVAQVLLDTPALARMMPAMAAVVGVAGVAWQVAAWWRRPVHPILPGQPVCAAALLYGARLGGHCVRRCAGLTAALLAAGIMERSTMVCAFVLVAAESVGLRER
ncbi:Predicted metal-binding integral membrane protein [Massilia sp. PDC64]|nr:Predicted metal-binding integral membrane protein [Massilia sp. PDC64]